MEETASLAFSKVLGRREVDVTGSVRMSDSQRGTKARVVQRLGSAMWDVTMGARLVSDAAGFSEAARAVRFKPKDFKRMFPDGMAEDFLDTCVTVYGQPFEDRVLSRLKKRYEGRGETIQVVRSI